MFVKTLHHVSFKNEIFNCTKEKMKGKTFMCLSLKFPTKVNLNTIQAAERQLMGHVILVPAENLF